MRLITYDGRTQNLRAWAKEIGIGWRTLQQRLAKGWPLEQALSAGKGELYKGKPALASLARKAGVSARVAIYRRAVGHPMEKVLQPGVLPHPPQRPLTLNGQTKSLTANELGVSRSALGNRLSRGWPLDRALFLEKEAEGVRSNQR
jgi:lambda repressor-like predicted transcriptional regulator